MFFAWIKSLFRKPQAVKKPRQRHGTTLADLVLLELKRGGHGTSVEIAQRLNANAGSVGNVLSILSREGKVTVISKSSRYIVWGLR